MSGKRGRPLGFKLSDASKRAISIAKTGQQHRPETKDKISRSLVMYFRGKNPLSEEIANRYSRINSDTLQEWLHNSVEDIDMSFNIMTEKAILNKNKIELTCGSNIEFFSHNITPELIVMFKEYCELNNILPEDFF